MLSVKYTCTDLPHKHKGDVECFLENLTPHDKMAWNLSIFRELIEANRESRIGGSWTYIPDMT